MSIRLRLTLWYSGILAGMLLSFGVAFYYYMDYTTYQGVRSQIREQALRLPVKVSIDFWDRLDLNISSGAIQGEFFIQLYNYKEGGMRRSANLHNAGLSFPVPDASDTKKSLYEGFDSVKVNGYSFIVYQRPIIYDNTLIGLLQVGAYTGLQERYLANLRTILIFSSLIAILIAFTVGLLLARQALRPIENVIRAARQIERGSDLSVRIPLEGPPHDEMGRLTGTLNGMLARIEKAYNELDEAYKAQRRFVSDASHELRTPLTTIRGNIDLLERMWLPALEAPGGKGEPISEEEAERAAIFREAMRDISEEAKRMSRLVGDLLSLARADAGYVMEKTDLALLPIVEEVARRAQLLPRKAEWRVGDLSAIVNAHVRGNPDFLRQLLFIFIENAFKYTPHGYVELSARRSADQAGIVVRDTGIGMNKEQVPHIFERFYRADESRGKTAGTGLGLSIAKWILDEHGGSVEVTTKEGAGSTFVIWLPATFPEPSDSDIMEPTGH
ncbi:two-component system sensor histidine kinase [Paenibacillus sp. 32O-W]|jgi:signal transduction histidine kinase|uniref:sensor histidine kinase n=1 Tax=Paenibacillus sp. 32O-W TaxID=1695218 RepID=UPI000722A39E|nr:HAMP domain-containing sensor histidine kinase [Paenibacillus sp. 32O-W]ALS26817.1 two-component system sensor histidine kinase [Paenibacillus sp. 32O-W]